MQSLDEFFSDVPNKPKPRRRIVVEEESTGEDDDDDDDDDDDGGKKAANISDDESSLIKNQLINEEPQLPKQCLPSTLEKKSETSQKKMDSGVQDANKINNGSDNDNDNDVVPSKEGSLLRCSEIWDRITTVSYTHLDVYKRQLST